MSKDAEGVKFTVTTGTSTNKQGSSLFHLHYFDRHRGKTVANGYDKVPGLFGKAKDTVTTRIDASTANIGNGVLGQWETRNVELPNGIPITLQYALKEAGTMKFKQEVYIPLVFSTNAPFIEARFPVITDSRSTVGNLVLQGRFYVPEYSEFCEKWSDNDAFKRRIIECMDNVGDGIDFEEGTWEFPKHTREVLKHSVTEEDTAWIAINTGMESFMVTLRQIAAAERDTERTALSKKVAEPTTGNRKNVVISKKRKRISL